MHGMKYEINVKKIVSKNTWKKSKGSITIEASFLMPILLVVIIMLVFIAIFCYNKITVWKNTYYAGMKLVEAKREGNEYDLEKEWKRISKDTLVLPENMQISQKNVLDSIVVTGKVYFTIPFWGKVEIKEKSAVPLCSSREKTARNRLWKK